MALADWFRRRAPPVIGRTAIIYCAALSAYIACLTFVYQDYRWFAPDFSVFWTVGDMVADARLAEVYDWQAVTHAHPLDHPPGTGARPWVYPPPALFAARGLAVLPMWTSFGVWVALGCIVYAVTVWRCWPQLQPWVVILSVLGWPVHSALNTGQSAPLIAAAVIAALAVLDRRPVLAGALLAVAALMKPSVLVLAPLAMIAGRHWRALSASVATGLVGLAATTAVFGPGLWWLWFGSLDGFVDYVATLGLHERAVTPRAMAELLGASGGIRLTLQLSGIIAGIAICWTAFRRTGDLSFRLFGLIGGGFLATPYAMHYELATVIPAAAALLVRPKQRFWDLVLIIPAMLIFFPIPPVTAILTTVATVWIVIFAALRLGPVGDGGRPARRGERIPLALGPGPR